MKLKLDKPEGLFSQITFPGGTYMLSSDSRAWFTLFMLDREFVYSECRFKGCFYSGFIQLQHRYVVTNQYLGAIKMKYNVGLLNCYNH